MFTQPCFIRKNTPELREKLEELGYKYNGRDTASWGASALYCFDGKYYEVYPAKPSRYHSIVDCGTNEELFLALAALRDDTDKNQWFIMDVEVYTNINKGDWFIATDMNGGKHIGAQIEPTYCYKATVEEIIEHFKDK